jgi:hypothetical protein
LVEIPFLTIPVMNFKKTFSLPPIAVLWLMLSQYATINIDATESNAHVLHSIACPKFLTIQFFNSLEGERKEPFFKIGKVLFFSYFVICFDACLGSG